MLSLRTKILFKFLKRKFAIWNTRYYWCLMKDNENVSKFTISLEKDLFDWVEEQVIDINKKDRRAKSSRSAVIAHAVQAMKESEQGKAQTVIGAVTSPASENSASGPSIRKKKTFRKAG